MKPIDYDYWFSFDYWTPEQAAYLFTNINPADQEHISLLNEPKYQKAHANHWVSIKTYQKILNLIEGTDFSKYDSKPAPDEKISLSALFKFANDQNLGRFPSRLVKEWEGSRKNPNRSTPTHPAQNKSTDREGSDGYFGQKTADAFDPLPISGIADLFFAATTYKLDQWKKLATRAKRNGLHIARAELNAGSGERYFNPVLVANWLISNKGMPAEKLERKLKNNMPERSRDQKEDIFGID